MTSQMTKTITEDELQAIIDHLNHLHTTKLKTWLARRDCAMIIIMYETGIRVSEVVQLRCTDLIWDCSPVSVLTVRAEIAKRHKERRVPISTRAHNFINNLYHLVWPHFDNIDSNAAFYAPLTGSTITPRQVQRILHSASKVAINRRVTPHMLRHSFGTRMMRVTSARVVQQLLGHEHLSSTEIYMHPGQAELTKAITDAERIE